MSCLSSNYVEYYSGGRLSDMSSVARWPAWRLGRKKVGRRWAWFIQPRGSPRWISGEQKKAVKDARNESVAAYNG